LIQKLPNTSLNKHMATLLNTILGTATFGDWGSGLATIKDPAVCQEFFDCCKKSGINQLDSARTYGKGSCEELIASLKYEEQGFLVDTKILSFFPGAHVPEKITDSIRKSLDALKTKKVNIMYLHAPDPQTPFEDTLRTVNEFYKEGVFEKFGLSNYSTEQVEAILKICKEKNYVKPTVYQGQYNIFSRKNEETLFPLLKKEKISFYAYSPMAAGFFKQQKGQEQESGSRFGSEHFLGTLYQNYYFKDSLFKGLEKLGVVSEKFGLTSPEVAIRWIYFHSQLKKEDGDGVIFGASANSGTKQLESNLELARKGPLPKEIVSTLEEIWKDVAVDAPPYYR